jgi:predicted enzyme related to lactoylglutathione lyase
MTLTLSHCFVYALDQDESLRFYRDVVGLQVRVDMPMNETMRWITVGPADQPDVELMLSPVGLMMSPEDADTVRVLVTKGVLPGVIFGTDDCRAVFEKMTAAGAEVLQEPITQDYGVLDCAFRDPAGNMIRFSEQLSG